MPLPCMMRHERAPAVPPLAGRRTIQVKTCQPGTRAAPATTFASNRSPARLHTCVRARAHAWVLHARLPRTCHHLCVEVVWQLVRQGRLHREGLVQELLVERLLGLVDLHSKHTTDVCVCAQWLTMGGGPCRRGRRTVSDNWCVARFAGRCRERVQQREPIVCSTPLGTRTMMTATPCRSYCGRPARPIICSTSVIG